MPRISRPLERLVKYIPANKQLEIKPLVSKIDTLIKKGQNCGKAQPATNTQSAKRVTDYNILNAYNIFNDAVNEVRARGLAPTKAQAIRLVLKNGVHWGIAKVTLDTVVAHGSEWGISRENVRYYNNIRS